MRRLITVMLLALTCAACSSMGGKRHEPDQAQAPSREIAILNHGYAMLYNKAGEFSKINKLLLVKIQTDKVGHVIGDLGNYGDTMQKRLKKMVGNYPSLHLDDTGLPVIEAEKRRELSSYFLHKMLPLVGRTGKAFDRTILQTQKEEINQARMYVKALIVHERSAHRKTMLRHMKKHLDTLYKRVSDLLEANYYAT